METTKWFPQNSGIFALLFVFFLLFYTPLKSQPVLYGIKAAEVRSGARAQLVLLGEGFTQIQSMHSVSIGGFKVVVIDKGLPAFSNNQMNVLIRIPRQLKPGSYPIVFNVSGDGFRKIELIAQIGKAAEEPVLNLFLNNRPIADWQGQPVSFDSTIVGGQATLLLKIRNDGPGKLYMNDISLPEGFRMQGELPRTIQGMDSVVLPLEMATTSVGLVQGRVRLLTNDPKKNPLYFNLRGSVLPKPRPEMKIAVGDSLYELGEKPLLDFGEVVFGDTVFNKMIIKNSGNDALLLSDLGKSTAFTMEPLFPIKIVAGDSAILTVSFLADSVAEYDSELTFKTNMEGGRSFTFQARASALQSPLVANLDTTVSASSAPFATTDTLTPQQAQSTDTIIPDVAGGIAEGEQTGVYGALPAWLKYLLILLAGALLIWGIILLVKKLAITSTGSGSKIVPLSEIHFATKVDPGIPDIGQNKLLGISFRFKLQPVPDFGQVEMTQIVPAVGATKIKKSKAEQDDLTLIEGIGPVISRLLLSSDILTFEQLSATQVQVLKDLLHNAKLNLADPTTWPEQAKLASGAEWKKLDRLQKELKGGRVVKNPKL